MAGAQRKRKPFKKRDPSKPTKSEEKAVELQAQLAAKAGELEHRGSRVSPHRDGPRGRRFRLPGPPR